jgi:glucoamylase
MANFQASGAIVAAPSQTHPDYFYHWVRDAAISMKSFYDHVCASPAACDARMRLYVDWIAKAQQQSDPNGIDVLGEPKYYISGEVYDKPWGRPQTDSPALRAIAVTQWAEALLKTNGTDYVLQHLWVADATKHSVIKWDLEFVSHNWNEDSFDLWEETKGQHFFTRMVQRRALLDGAALARKLSDDGAATYYEQQAKALEAKIDEHWDGNIIRATMPGSVGPMKYRSLDSAVVLGALYGSTGDGFYGPKSDKVIKTAKALEQSLSGVYAINAKDDAEQTPGFLVGRYPNDTYTGYETGGLGNPWILCTHAMAEMYYHAGGADGCREGDARMARVHKHVKDLGMHLGEQINRDDGSHQGAPDLTWSYGTLFNAMAARTAAGC